MALRSLTLIWLVFNCWFLMPISAQADYDWQYWNEAPGHKYAATLARGSWHQMENEALAAGGHLVTINSASENSWVKRTFYPLPPFPPETPVYQDLWIGYHRVEASEDPAVGWEWSSGEPVTYTNWLDGLPERRFPPFEYQRNYASLDNSWLENGNWLDREEEFFITFGLNEVSAVPLPPTLLLLGSGFLALAGLRIFRKS